MAERPNATLVAGLGDLHVGAAGQGAPVLRALFEEMSEAADVIVLCGDLTNVGAPREAETLAEAARAARVPVTAVLGNHDYEGGQVEEVKRLLSEAGVHFLEDGAHEIKGVGFAGVKGFAGGFGARMLGRFGEPAIKQFVDEAVSEAMRLENELRSLTCERLVVALHYSPIAGTVAGEAPEIYPFLGSSRLSETIDRFEGVRAVLHGHSHHGTYHGSTPGGVPVYNCAYPVLKESGRPYALVSV